MLHPEEKNLHCMMNLVQKFSKREVLVVDVFRGTFATAKAYSMTLRHRIFVVCEIDNDCFNKSVQGLVEVYANQA